jgi:hypothetical protein
LARNLSTAKESSINFYFYQAVEAVGLLKLKGNLPEDKCLRGFKNVRANVLLCCIPFELGADLTEDLSLTVICIEKISCQGVAPTCAK